LTEINILDTKKAAPILDNQLKNLRKKLDLEIERVKDKREML